MKNLSTTKASCSCLALFFLWLFSLCVYDARLYLHYMRWFEHDNETLHKWLLIKFTNKIYLFHTFNSEQKVKMNVDV